MENARGKKDNFTYLHRKIDASYVGASEK